MPDRTTLTVAVLCLLLAVPSSLASWTGRGFYEPDTAYDRTSGYMFADPDTTPTDQPTPVRKVYFSAYTGYYVLTPNHNVGTLGSQVATYPTNIHYFLGVWKDCNKDGYIGLADSAALEYRVELLLDRSVCKPVPTPDPVPAGWMPSHNDGEWVREFLWIGPDYRQSSSTNDGCYNTPDWESCTRDQNATNPFNVADESARIWSDWGLPNDAPTASCPVNPRPRGTYQSTGGFLRYADCFTSWRATGATNDADDLAGIDSLGLGQVSFDDAPKERPDQSASILNQRNPYGRPSDASYVSAFDCSSPTRVTDPTGASHQRIVSPTNGQPMWVNASGDDDRLAEDENPNSGYTILRVNAPRAPTANPAGSPAGTVNQTLEDAAADCNRTDGSGETSDVYAIDEDDFEGGTPKRALNDIFGFFVEGRRDYDTGTEKDLDDVLGRGRPSDGGEGVAYMQTSTTYWFGTPGYAVSRNPYVNRDNLQPWGAVSLTSYAWVDPALPIDLPSGPTRKGVYGSSHCVGPAPITGFWECDPSKWWLQPDGAGGTTSGRNLWQAAVGDYYNLVDVDCFDASLAKGTPSVTGELTGVTCSR